MTRLPVKDPEEESEIDKFMSKPIMLQRPSQVRTVSPEAWIWTDIFYGYILWSVQKIGPFSYICLPQKK